MVRFPMARLLILALALALAGTATAQLYRWVDESGRVRYTDRPPPAGVKSRTIAAPAAPSTPAAPAADKGERSGPLTPAEREQAFQKRRQEEQKAADKAAAAEKDAAVKQENCRRARESLATLQSGQRIRRTNAQGEQYYLDDSARAGEIQSAQRAVQDWCS
jgi:hypothetical protein